MGHHISRIFMIPMLSPHKFQRFIFGQMFFDRIVGSLNQHIVKTCSFQNIGHGWWQTKGINCPSITENKSKAVNQNMLLYRVTHMYCSKYSLIQGVPAISTHFWFQFLTFLMVLSKKSNSAILTQMV